MPYLQAVIIIIIIVIIVIIIIIITFIHGINNCIPETHRVSRVYKFVALPMD